MEHVSSAPHAPSSGQTPPRRRSWFRMFLRFVWVCVLLLLLVIGGIAGITGGALYSFYSELPDIDRLENFRPSLVTKVYDRNKEVIGEFFI